MIKFSYVKYIILGFSIALSLVLFGMVQSIDSSTLQLLKLEQFFGFISISFLFLALVSKPLYEVFPKLITNTVHKDLVQSLTISTLYFALLHSSINFFGLLQGFKGLPFLALPYLLAICLGFSAILIVSVLILSGFSFIQKFGWFGKIVEYSTYALIVIIASHVLLVGTHFHSLRSPAALTSIIGFFILSFLYLIALRNKLSEKYQRIPSRIITATLSLCFILILYGLYTIYGIMLGSHIH